METSTLMFNSDRLGPYNFPQKSNKTRPKRKEMDGNVLNIPQSPQFYLFLISLIEVPFPTCTLTWHVNDFDSRQREGMMRKNESTNIIDFGVIFPNLTTS